MASRTGKLIAGMMVVGLLLPAMPLAAQAPQGNYPAQNNPQSNAGQAQPGGLRQPVDNNWQSQVQPMQGNAGASTNAPAKGNPGLQQPSLQQPSLQQSGQTRTPNPTGASPAAGAMPVQIQAGPLPVPFTLTPEQQIEMDKLLTEWEAASSKVDLFSCDVVRMEYDPAFGGPNGLRTVSKGELKYQGPDKGLFHIKEASDYVQDPQSKQWQLKPGEPQEYWTCDGKSTYQVDFKQKLIIQTPIPPEMQGKSITEGPLPFVFGAKAETLKKRYYLRIITPPSEANAHVWLEAFPKMQKDAANFAWVELILTKDTKLPVAIQIYNPGCDPKIDHNQQSRTMIELDKPSVNNAWGKLQQMLSDFSRPNILGFKLVLQQNLVPPPTTPQISGGAPPATQQMPSGAVSGNEQAGRLRQPTR